MIRGATFLWALGLAALGAGCVGEPGAPGGPPGMGGAPGTGMAGTGGGRAGAPVPPVEPPDASLPPDAEPPPPDAPPPDAAPDPVDLAAPAPDGGGDGPAAAGPWARNVRVGLVEAAQGPFVRLGQGAMVVPLAMRNAPVIEGRPLFVRAHLQTEAAYAPRTLRAVLTVQQGESGRDFEETKLIAGPSTSERLESSFNFLVPAEAVRPRAGLSVAVYELDAAGGESPEPAQPPRFPAAGVVDLGVKAGRMVLDLVLVPAVGVGGPIDDSPARRKSLENHLYDVYPVQKLNVRWREPLRFTTRISAAQGFAALAEARMEDGAKASEYYHLMIARADTREAFLGIANLAGPTERDGARRIGITFLEPRVADASVDSTSHEIGHNHGRNHAPNCGAGGPDPGYPYAMGALGVDGISLSEGVLYRRGGRFDIMGYCSPTWISDYTWRGFEQRVRAVSAYSQTPVGMALAQRSLQGFVAPGERPVWAVVPGSLAGGGAAAFARQRARLTMGDGSAREAAVSVQTLSDDRTREIAVDLPAEGTVRALTVVVGGERFEVPADVLGRL